MILNAKISSTMLGPEDHGIPSFSVTCDQGGTVQGFGGYDLRHPAHQTLIFELLSAVGVRTWEDLPGTFVRIDRKDGRIKRIGHIVEDTWLDMDKRISD